MSDQVGLIFINFFWRTRPGLICLKQSCRQMARTPRTELSISVFPKPSFKLQHVDTMNENENLEFARNTLKTELKKNPLFRFLSDAQMAQLMLGTRLLNVTQGEVIFRQGSEAASFYHVVSGLVKLHRQSPEGQEKIFQLARPGRAFAEALISRQFRQYPVTATAAQNSTVIAINIIDYMRVLESSFDTSLMVIADLSQRLHELIEEIDQLSLLSGRRRLATYLLDSFLQKGNHFSLEVPKKEIASLLALQPETFSRLLKELTDDQVIVVDGKQIEVLDGTLLREKAGIR